MNCLIENYQLKWFNKKMYITYLPNTYYRLCLYLRYWSHNFFVSIIQVTRQNQHYLLMSTIGQLSYILNFINHTFGH